MVPVTASAVNTISTVCLLCSEILAADEDFHWARPLLTFHLDKTWSGPLQLDQHLKRGRVQTQGPGGNQRQENQHQNAQTDGQVENIMPASDNRKSGRDINCYILASKLDNIDRKQVWACPIMPRPMGVHAPT